MTIAVGLTNVPFWSRRSWLDIYVVKIYFICYFNSCQVQLFASVKVPGCTLVVCVAVNMKIKRQKQAKKTISFYKHSFNLREPFQILIDGTFCQAALKNKIQIKEQLPKYLMGEVQLCTTKWVRLLIFDGQPELESLYLLLFSSCAMKELESLGKELYGAKIILQKYQTRKCPHMKSPVPASECLLSMLEETNPHHYFVATQVNIQKHTCVEIRSILALITLL